MSPVFLLALAACHPVLGGDTELAAQQVAGVWVFTYVVAGGLEYDALNTGEVAVVDDCLRVGDALVVWHPEQLPVVEEALARVAAGEAPKLTVAGGGSSRDESEDFALPDVLAARCAADAVWYGASSEPTFAE